MPLNDVEDGDVLLATANEGLNDMSSEEAASSDDEVALLGRRRERHGELPGKGQSGKSREIGRGGGRWSVLTLVVMHASGVESCQAMTTALSVVRKRPFWFGVRVRRRTRKKLRKGDEVKRRQREG